jgi:citrate lyase beta subunit
LLDLVLFASSGPSAAAARAAGLEAGIVDLEWQDKERRQAGADTEINRDRPEDVAALRAAGIPRRLCRIDGPGRWTPHQVEAVLAAGATEILLPMVREAADARALLAAVGGRARCGILVETPEAVERAGELAGLELDSIYVGLNDLAIGRGSPHLFVALLDGTVDRLRAAFSAHRFGVAAATTVDGGRPVPSRLLLAELARLGCDFTFLRRSFRRDLAGRDLATEVGRIRSLWTELGRRDAGEVVADRRRFVAAVESAFPDGGTR